MVNNKQVLAYALDGMRNRQLRNYLTILGIVIGIASIVILISLAQGIDKSIRDEFSSFGTNYVAVIPGNPFGSGFSFGPPVFKGALYERDADALRKLPGVKIVSASVSPGYVNVEYRGKNIKTQVIGVEIEAYREFIRTGFESGNLFQDGDQSGVVIGYNVAHNSFGEDLAAGKVITISGKQFKVRGVINRGGGAASFDDDILIDKKAAKALLGPTADKNRLASIFVVTDDDADPEKVAADIERILARQHKVSLEDKDFSALTAASITAQIGQVTSLLAVFLGGIAAISLIVGGIGIANAMFTSVLERTREIGILKAIGADSSTILRIFLFESALIGFLGGVVGILFALGVSLLLGRFGVPTLVTPELVIFALVFAVASGTVSGYFPARNASRLQPVEALRYE